MLAVSALPGDAASDVASEFELDSLPLPGLSDVADSEVEAMAESFGLTEDEARAFIVLGQEVGRVYDELVSRDVEGFAGIWFDDQIIGLPHIGWSSNSSRGQVLADSVLGIPDVLDTVEVNLTLDELNEVQSTVQDTYERLHRRFGLVGYYVDPPSNTVVLEVRGHDLTPADETELVSLFPESAVRLVAVGGDVDTAIPPSALGCQAYDTACNPLRGGIDLSSCTLGFNANAASNRYVITAAHCSNSQSHNGSSVGSVANSKQGGGGSVDAQVHAVPSAWNTSRWVAHRSNDQALQIMSVQPNHNIAVGTGLCHRGKGSGNNPICVGVKAADWAGTWRAGETYTDMLLTDWCNNSGDSGGPVYTRGTAYGIMKGYRLNALGGCSWTISSHTYNVQRALGVEVTTR